ncbi:pectin acetylesterase 8-like [Salvia splendens]|uniref:pectin acetylesterase 8-like n=1 Tax=Salvia splendens TaxID=180675 RepID=UPI001C25184E|nr:pectin acetylesterase 8-like [Salvia splendens]
MWKLHCMIICLMAACLLASSFNVSFTEVANATQRRAVCMDGSPAGYYYSAGSGDGAKNWLLFLMGGGWCDNVDDCQSKLNQSLGSSKFMPSKTFSEVLSPNSQINPDFYNWNRIFVAYCDQSSFLGDTEFDGQGPRLQFRGSRIFDAVVDDLLAKGMGVGENAILSGISAGGLATILHCDGFRARLPDVGRVKCLSDGGFFFRGENVLNADYREKYFASVITLHNISSLLPVTCTERIDPSLCFFPENLVRDIQTPIFILDSAFDAYQVRFRLVPPSSYDRIRWDLCLGNISTCTSTDKQLITDFGGAFLKAVREISNNPTIGMFIHACLIHTVLIDGRFWTPNSTIKLGNLSIQEAFANWYFDREPVTLITTANFLEICTKKKNVMIQ